MNYTEGSRIITRTKLAGEILTISNHTLEILTDDGWVKDIRKSDVLAVMDSPEILD